MSYQTDSEDLYGGLFLVGLDLLGWKLVSLVWQVGVGVDVFAAVAVNVNSLVLVEKFFDWRVTDHQAPVAVESDCCLCEDDDFFLKSVGQFTDHSIYFILWKSGCWWRVLRVFDPGSEVDHFDKILWMSVHDTWTSKRKDSCLVRRPVVQVVSAVLSEREVAGSIPTISDFLHCRPK